MNNEERLTTKWVTELDGVEVSIHYDAKASDVVLMTKLGMYEDTGLSPEEITKLVEGTTKLLVENNNLKNRVMADESHQKALREDLIAEMKNEEAEFEKLFLQRILPNMFNEMQSLRKDFENLRARLRHAETLLGRLV